MATIYKHGAEIARFWQSEDNEMAFNDATCEVEL